MARRTRSYDSLYTYCAPTQFSASETLRDTVAKKDEDADLVVEIRITAESPTAARRADVEYSCWNSLGAMEKVPSTNNRSAVVRCSCSGDGSFGRRRRGPLAVVNQQRLPLSSPRSQCNSCPTDFRLCRQCAAFLPVCAKLKVVFMTIQWIHIDYF